MTAAAKHMKVLCCLKCTYIRVMISKHVLETFTITKV